MDDFDTLLARYRAGERMVFGPQVALARGVLYLRDTSLPLNTLEALRRDADGNARVRRFGWDEVPFIVQTTEADDVALLVQVVNHLTEAIPYLHRRSTTGWPPGSIGDISAHIGTDVRDLLVAGYTDDQIRGLLRKEYTLDELFAQRPQGPPLTLRRR